MNIQKRIRKLKNVTYFLIFGIVFDILTTLIGYFKGFEEANPLGFTGVFIANPLIILYFWYLIYKLDKGFIPKLLDTKFYYFAVGLIFVVGLLRVAVGFWNIFVILEVIVHARGI